MVEEHLSDIRQVFEKLQAAELSRKLSKCYFFSKVIQYLGPHSKHKGHPTITFKDASHPENESANNT